MQELKQIILSRIKDIKQIQHINQTHITNIVTSTNRYELILKQKNGEENRNNREIVMLSIANGCGFSYEDTQLQAVIYQICSTYDPQTLEVKNYGDDVKNRIYVMLRGFFSRNGYKEKIGYLKAIFNRSYGNVSVGLIFTLLSEWSKKQYLQTLSTQIKDIKSRYNIPSLAASNSTHRISEHDSDSLALQLHSQKSLSSLTIDVNSVRSDNYRNAIQKSMPLNKNNSSTNYNTISNVNVNVNINTNKNINTNRNSSVGSINSAKLLTIYSRMTLYGYFVDELEEYYQLTGIGCLDKAYVKVIPKKKMKENLCLVENINRAVQVLIQCSTNKLQRAIIKEYISQYKLYDEEIKRSKMKKMEQSNRKKRVSLPQVDINKNQKTKSTQKNTRTMSDHLSQSQIKPESEKKLSVDLQAIRQKDIKQGIQDHEYAKNMSSSLLGPSKQNENLLNNIRESIKKKLIHRQSSKNDEIANVNKIKFPTLSRSMQKKQKSMAVEKTKIYRFPTQLEQQPIQNLDQQSKESLFKFSQRQTIKGIIIKNFLSNREKQKQKKANENSLNSLSIRNKQEEQSSKKTPLKIQNQEKEKRSPQPVDIRSLRQKTKALLKNFKVMQNY